MTINEKLQLLREKLNSFQSLVVAYSGGVDSTFLLEVAYEVLGEKVLAVTAHAAIFSQREYDEAQAFLVKNGIPHQTVVFEELKIKGFAANSSNRCYLCKKELLTKFKEIAVQNGFSYVAEGSNVDDLKDFRPGMRAVAELGIVSPLRETGLTKEEIRILSKKLGLPTWNKPSFACLASRFPYGQGITEEKLSAVERAEQVLFDLGFLQVRVRHHGDMARVEVLPEQFEKMLDEKIRKQIDRDFKELGFAYVTLDLQGYRAGSMNEVLL